MHKIGPRLLAIVVCLVLTIGGSDQPRSDIPEDALSIGEASLVVPNVSGRIGEVTRTISVEDNVFADEVINTADRGATRIVFKDSTELTVGANSSVVLDQFVYDPNAGAGSLVVNLLKGVFEFNSGDMASEAYRVNTPSATLAIRGTSFTAMITPGETPGTYDLTVSVTVGTVEITYVDDNGVTQVRSVGAGDMAIIRNLPLPQFAATGGTTAEITVENCSDTACAEGAFAAANAVLAEDLFSVIALSIVPEAGDAIQPAAGDAPSQFEFGSTLPTNSGGGGGGGGFDGRAPASAN